MPQQIDPELKAKIEARRAKVTPVDKLRRRARALNAVFEAIDQLPLLERVEVLEEVLEALDPQTDLEDAE